MTTLQEAIEDSRLWAQLVRRYPELRHSPMPAIDAMVVEFLRQHDVFVKPVGSNVNASPGMNAMMGAVGGPMAVGAAQALTAQSKGIALQEWTSWKQWTLSHPEWPEFKSEIETRHQLEIDRVSERISDPGIQEFIAEHQLKALRNAKIIFFGFLLGIPALGVLLNIASVIQQAPPSIHQGTEQKTQTVSVAAEQCRQKVIASGAGADHQYFAGVKADTDKSAYLVFQRPDGTRWEAAYYC